MAEPRDDTQPGRMLFTDFDASDKGRPVSALHDLLQPPGRDRPARGQYLPTLEELASTLDLDFEDDGHEEGSPRDRHRAAPSARPEPAPPPKIEPPAPTRSEPIVKSAVPPPPMLPENIPTWEEYMAGLSQVTAGDREAALNETGVVFGAQPGENGRAAAGAASDDFDILSSLGPDDEDDAVYRPYEGEYRGQRLGVRAPRAVPYGGIQRLDEWYRPPEVEEGEERRLDSVADWYEPPEDYLPGDAPYLTETDDDTYTAAEGARPARDVTETVWTPFHPDDDASGGPESAQQPDPTETGTSRNIDLFSGVDIDQLWREKVNHGGQGTRRSSRTFDVFADLDLEATWRDKQESAASSSSGEPGPNSTIIMKPDFPENAATVILEPDAAITRAQASRTTVMPTPAPVAADRPPPTFAPPPASGLVVEDDALSFLDDLDAVADAGPDATQRNQVAVTDPAPAAREGTAKAAPDSDEEFFNLDALIAEADADAGAARSDIAAPVVGDEDIASLRRPKQSSRTEAPAVAEAPETEPEPDPASLIDTNAFDDAFDGVGVKADVAPPRISDNDIETPPEPVKKSNTGEMRALFGPKGDKSAGADAPVDESQAEADEEPVAVNPMDVFANMDDMDFSGDGLDDEMKAMLDEGGEAGAEGEEAVLGAAGSAVETETPPDGLPGKIRFYARRALLRLVSGERLGRLKTMIAWRENWWFYCDLLAAVIASASLAVIISYFVWYR